MQTPKFLLRTVGGASALWLFLAEKALAQAGGSVTTTLMETVAFGMSVAILVLNYLTWMLFKFLDDFLDPAFIFGLDPVTGEETQLMEMLHQIWTLSRDLINILFVLMLVAGAIIMVVQAKSDKVKEYLPKFLLAVVVVNFSWFIPRAIFDFSQILTYTVFEIPSLMGNYGECKTTTGKPCKIALDIIFFKEAGTVTATGNFTKGGSTTSGWECPVKKQLCVRYADWTTTKAAGHTKVLNGLVINHARLSTLVQITNNRLLTGAPDPKTGPVMETIAFFLKIVVILLLHIGLFFPLFALTVAFFLRIPLLWITMAFMPFAAIGFVVGGVGGFDLKEMIWKKFLAAVFLPAIVGVPLTVGFIMLNAGMQMSNVPGASIGFPIIAGVDNLWQLMWLVMAFIVMWTGVFSVLKKDEIMGKFSASIEGIGKAAGTLAVKAPLALPIAPLGGASLLSIGHAMDPRKQLAKFDADFADDRRWNGSSGGNSRANLLANKLKTKPNVVTNVQLNFNDALKLTDPANGTTAMNNAIQKVRGEFSEFKLEDAGTIIEAIGIAANNMAAVPDWKKKHAGIVPPAPAATAPVVPVPAPVVPPAVTPPAVPPTV